MAKIGLIEVPAFKLMDSRGSNWTALRHNEPLGSKQVLAGHLMSAGFEVELFNLRSTVEETELGEVSWRGMNLTKVAVGMPWTELDPRDCDVWGLTINYLQERDVSCSIIRHLTAGGGRVVVGGSDAFVEPEPYLAAGAAAVVRDKSGAANTAVLDHVLGHEPREPLSGVALGDGRELARRHPPMQPQEWCLPTMDFVKQTLGVNYWEAPLPDALKPIGAVMLDIGCDRSCDFCATPLYKISYRKMDPQRALDWMALQKEAGAKSVIVLSDQFLGRVLWKEGRKEILEIMAGMRELGLAVLWGNGLEVRKATLGRGLPDSDQTPDPELVDALWGWDGERGCAQAYIPAERPVANVEDYPKLLPWREHCEMLRTIIRAGLPSLTYGVIVGLPDDSPESCRALVRAVGELRDDLKSINPDLEFHVVPYAIRPLAGTPAAREIRELGLIRFDDPAIVGGFWTACADTHHMSYEEVSDWQQVVIDELSDDAIGFQGMTGVFT